MQPSRRDTNTETTDSRNRRLRGGNLAFARELFLTAEPVQDGVVRDSIMASWVRSRDWRVDACNLELPYQQGIDHDSLLTHTAEQILDDINDQFADEPACVILTDPQGVVLDRRTGDDPLRQKLDRVSLAPGFSYAEQFAGTNGIGTALHGNGPTMVIGHEHYVEHLEDLACAGAPIRHPTTAELVGLIDITCWRTDANPTMAAAAASIAGRIEAAMLAQVGRRELGLFNDYLAACRRNHGPVLAVGDDLVIMNDSARELIEPNDLETLLGLATQALATGRTRIFTTTLPSGATARVHCKPSWMRSPSMGGIVQVQPTAPEETDRPAHRVEPVGRYALPGVAGSNSLWLRCRQEVETYNRAGEWLDLEGEVGVGKLTLARATHLIHAPQGHLRVLDADDCADPDLWLSEVHGELAGGTGTLILRHVDHLAEDVLVRLGDLLATARAGVALPKPWVVVTRGARSELTGGLGSVVDCLPRSVAVPPLRHHMDDLPELVALQLKRLTRGADLSCSPEAMRALMRNRWPGNVAQLVGTLRKVVAHRRTGVIEFADLPAECLAISGRVLSQVEAIERDAIVESLISTNGDRAAAARDLGMSRATIYRKIRNYGITVPTRSRRG
ncbi:sigma-54-dependent Fis family transcriptional regulator [Actinokineospora sp.]|uniref:sigma-54-dependent Fis family transcriptional regulator n=1 Tax=Actinokineospora sp. TaxID=1872133 RepID=UPI0040380014